jgi:hypothetical protein
MSGVAVSRPDVQAVWVVSVTGPVLFLLDVWLPGTILAKRQSEEVRMLHRKERGGVTSELFIIVTTLVASGCMATPN